MTVVFPGLQKEYIPFLEYIGSQLGMVIRTGERNKNKNGHLVLLPSVRILMNTIAHLPSFVNLPCIGGGKKEQRLQFIGLSNQCFYCKKMGHFVQNCEQKKSKESRGGMVQATQKHKVS